MPDVTFRDAGLHSRVLRGLNAGGAALRKLGVEAPSLTPETLLRTARRDAGCDDPGEPSIEEPLGVLCDSLEREAGLSTFGRIGMRGLLLSNLKNRLQLVDWAKRHPEVREERIERPWIVVGLPAHGHDAPVAAARARPPRAPPRTVGGGPAHPAAGPGQRARGSAHRDQRPGDRTAPRSQPGHPRHASHGRHARHGVRDALRLRPARAALRDPGLHARLRALARGDGHGQRLPHAPPRPAGAAVAPADRHLVAEDPEPPLVPPDPARTLPGCAHPLDPSRPGGRGALGGQPELRAADALRAAGGSPGGGPRLAGESCTWASPGASSSTPSASARTRRSGASTCTTTICSPTRSARCDAPYAHFGDELHPLHERRMRAWMRDRPQDLHGRHRYASADFGFDDDEVRERFADYTRRFEVTRPDGDGGSMGR